MIIAYNFGYHVPELGGGVFGYCEIFTCKTFRQFSDQIRNPVTIRELMNFARKQHVPRSSITILVNIDNLHKFTIKLKNVREYKQAVDDWIKKRDHDLKT